MRDRSVKAVQYGCLMLIGFYGDQMSAEMLECLQLMRRTTSTSRKAFWLLKSINHLHSASLLVPQLIDCSGDVLCKGFQLLEQVCLVMYFVLENLVFLCRVRISLGQGTEADLEDATNWSWFAGDLAGFLALAFDCRASGGLSLDLAISAMELAVSTDFVHGWRRLLGRDLGDGPNGMLGMMSSLLTLVSGARLASATLP